MELAVTQIKTALVNTLSNDQSLREQANQFLMKQCEPDPQFQIALLHIIKSFSMQSCTNSEAIQGQVAGEAPKLIFQSNETSQKHRQPTPEDIQIQYQAILCMKNSLTRLLQQHRSRTRTYAPSKVQQTSSVSSTQNSSQQQQTKTVSFAASAGNKRKEPLPEELRAQIKAQLLEMIDTPENIILSKSCYEQLTLVVTIFIKYDFPVAWPQLNQWMTKSLEALHANMHNLQLEDAPRVQRFLGFYLEVLKEQRKKQLGSKSHFQKMSKEHLKGIVRVWLFFNAQQSKMVVDPVTQELQPLRQTYNETLFQIAAKLDKLLFNIVGCGFSINNLVAEPESNSFVETVTHLIQKLALFVDCVERVTTPPTDGSAPHLDKEKFCELLVIQVKTFLKNLCILQSSEPLLMFGSLDQYLQILARILHRHDVYPVRVQKLALYATFKVVNVNCFNAGNNQRDATGHSDGIGILVSPQKFKHLEPQIAKASELYRHVMEMPLPQSDQVEEQTRQDGARRILELVTRHFLSQVDLSSWQSDPEYFIENEDERFLLECDLQNDCSVNLLAQHLIEKLLQKFYPTCYPFVQDILNQYFNGQINPGSVQVEDSLLNLVGIVGKVQKEYKVKLERRLDVNYVLQFIKSNKWANPDQSPIFRRRFLLILTHWVKIVPKPVFFELFSVTLESLGTLGTIQPLSPGAEGVQPLQITTLEQVLVFEHCLCVHEMLKEIHFWLDRADQYKKGTTTQMPGELPKDIIELRGSYDRFTESEEEQIAHCQFINSQINYAQLFQLVGSKLVPLLDMFKSPSLTWSMINCLSFILEKTVSEPQAIEGCLKYLNILRILEQQPESHVDEAIIDMLKNLLIQCPSSSVILEMCCTLLNFKLSKTLNDGSTMQFWLFTMRAVANDNPSLDKLKKLFVTFGGCFSSVPYGGQATGSTQVFNSVATQVIKRDYIFLEFLKVAHEAIMLDMFPTFEEQAQLTQFATQKFEAETQREQQNASQQAVNGSANGQSSGYSGDGTGGSLDSGMFEKKELLLKVVHILLWKVESTPAVDATLQQQKNILLKCCIYVIQSPATITVPHSNAFFQELVTYLNRVLIIKSEDFVHGIIQGELNHSGFTMDQFLKAWLSKMEMVVSWEANRIKTLAMLVMLPYLEGGQVQRFFIDIGNLLFPRLEHDLYFKLSNEKNRGNYSPNRFNQQTKSELARNPKTLTIKIHEKTSQRLVAMQREDWLLETDLMEVFWQKVRELMAKLSIQSIDPLADCLSADDHLKQCFVNLVNGYSPKYEQMKAEAAQDQKQKQYF